MLSASHQRRVLFGRARGNKSDDRRAEHVRAFPGAPLPDPTMIADQFTWFDAQLAKASSSGKKVWLLMHAPPGAVEGTSAQPSMTMGKSRQQR